MTMTLQQYVEAARAGVKVDCALAIDGIPVLFGTRAGRVWSGSSVGNAPSSWTTVEAIVEGSVKVGAAKLEMFSGLASGASVTLQLARSRTINRYLERGRTPKTLLTADLTVAGTTLTVESTTGFSADQYVYIGRETVRLGTIASGTSVTGCTRNAISMADSVAEIHFSSASGYRTEVSTGPNHMRGRPAILRVWVGQDDAVFTDFPCRMSADLEDSTSEGVWSVSLDDLSAILDRKVAVGFQGARIKTVEIGAPTKVYPDVMDDWGAANEAGQVWIQPHTESALPPALINVGTINADNFTVAPYALYSVIEAAGVIHATATGNDVDSYVGGSIRRAYVFRDYPMVMALKVLLSIGGDGTNHATWDVLFGRTLQSAAGYTYAAGESERRMGAGIPASLVDVTALEAFAGETRDGFFYVLGPRGEEDLPDILEVVAQTLGVVFYWNSSGQLSAKRMGAAYANDGSRSITAVDVMADGPFKSTDTEADVAHTINIHSNVWPDDTKARVHSQAQYNETRQLYRTTQSIPLEVTRKGLWVSAPGQPETPWRGIVPTPVDHRQLQQTLHRLFLVRNKLTRRYSVVTGGVKFLASKVADRVLLTHSNFNAFDGGSVSALALDVYEVTPELGDSVTLVVRETIGGKLLGPVGRVASVAGQVVTLTTNSTLFGGGTTPARYFGTDWEVDILSGSASPIWSTTRGGSPVCGSTITDDTIDFDGSLPGGVVAGDLVVARGYDSAAGSGEANSAQGALTTDYLFMADANFRLGAANAAAHRWG